LQNGRRKNIFGTLCKQGVFYLLSLGTGLIIESILVAIMEIEWARSHMMKRTGRLKAATKNPAINQPLEFFFPPNIPPTSKFIFPGEQIENVHGRPGEEGTFWSRLFATGAHILVVHVRVSRQPGQRSGLQGRKSGVYPYIAVGAIHHIDKVREKLRRELALLEREGVKVRLEENPAGKVTFFFCRLDNSGCPWRKNEDIFLFFRQYLAAALAELILDDYERLLLRRIIRENYYYLEIREQEIVYRLAAKAARKEGGKFLRAGRGQRQGVILKNLLDFLHQNNQIVIEGFIRFRLKEYIEDLEEAVEKAVDDYFLDKEYREFIGLLRYFVEIQKPRLDLVHVVHSSQGVFGLYNEQQQPIRCDSLREVFAGAGQGEVNGEDLVFGVLVSLAPREIIVHYPQRGNGGSVFLKTIKIVFRGRVRVCRGCYLCKHGRE
jgi:putative sporulation protein YtxC